jgi:hypothetical protein
MAFTFGTAQNAPLRLVTDTTSTTIPCSGCGRTVAERTDEGHIIIRRDKVVASYLTEGRQWTQCPRQSARHRCRAWTQLCAGMPLPPTVTTSMSVEVVSNVTVVEAPIAREALRLVA